MMDVKDRIEFIREHGTEEMKKGMRAVFGQNKYKPKRKEMWKKRLHKGRKMVKRIQEIQEGKSWKERVKEQKKNKKADKKSKKKSKDEPKKEEKGLKKFI